MLPSAAQSWAPWIGLLAVIGIIYGALCCLAQRDMKRLIAFSSVAHMGFVMLGIATLTDFGINAAIFGMVAHGLITGMLFFLAGSIQERYGTARDQPARRCAHPGAAPRVAARLLGHGVARSARSRRLLGRVPGDPLGLRTEAAVRSVRRPRRHAHHVPRLHGDRRGRHRARRRLPALDVPAGGDGQGEARVRARPHPRRPRVGVDRVGADARSSSSPSASTRSCCSR